MDDKRYAIGKVNISQLTPSEAKRRVECAAKEGINSYVCIANMRSVVYGNKHSDYAAVLNNSFMTTPDGMPLVWCAHCWGLKNVQRTTGPDLFVTMLKDGDSGIRHFLLGDTDETLDAINKISEYKNIVGSYSPPFCEVHEFDYEGIAERINKSGANVVWVSLRAPKQDFFAKRLLPLLDGKIVIGIGAAFRFAIGKIRHPNAVFQKAGLTGFFWRKGQRFQLLKTYAIFAFHLCIFVPQIWFKRAKSSMKNECNCQENP